MEEPGRGFGLLQLSEPLAQARHHLEESVHLSRPEERRSSATCSLLADVFHCDLREFLESLQLIELEKRPMIMRNA